MAGEITFNLIKDGVVGHSNVTIARGEFSMTLGNSGDMTAFPMGIYSPSFEKSRVWASTDLVQKTIVVDDARFETIKAYFTEMVGRSTHYGLYFAPNCIDFSQHVYELTGHDGHFSDLYSDTELDGPLGWWLRSERTVASGETNGETVAVSVYHDNVAASFGVSGAMVIAMVVIGSLLYNRVCTRGSVSIRRTRAKHNA